MWIREGKRSTDEARGKESHWKKEREMRVKSGSRACSSVGTASGVCCIAYHPDFLLFSYSGGQPHRYLKNFYYLLVQQQFLIRNNKVTIM